MTLYYLNFIIFFTVGTNPIYIYSAKGLVKRDFNAKEFDDFRRRQSPHVGKLESISRRKSSSTLSSFEKSQNMGQTQSPSSHEEDENEQPHHEPVYHLQKSVAGVIVVPEEKVSNRKLRCRQRSKMIEKFIAEDSLSRIHTWQYNKKLKSDETISKVNHASASEVSEIKNDPDLPTILYNTQISRNQDRIQAHNNNDKRAHSCSLKKLNSSMNTQSKELHGKLKKSVSAIGFRKEGLSSDNEKKIAKQKKRRNSKCPKPCFSSNHNLGE